MPRSGAVILDISTLKLNFGQLGLPQYTTRFQEILEVSEGQSNELLYLTFERVLFSYAALGESKARALLSLESTHTHSSELDSKNVLNGPHFVPPTVSQASSISIRSLFKDT